MEIVESMNPTSRKGRTVHVRQSPNLLAFGSLVILLSDYGDCSDVTTMFDHVSSPKIPAKISGVVRDFLKGCLTTRSCERLTAEKLGLPYHEVLRKLLLRPFVARPQSSKSASRTKMEVVRSLSHAGFYKSSVIVPRIPPRRHWVLR
ncbi:hypothetical protein DVH24_006353 [Malus domestica]|uniref:Uncharacterized protein n=1 Tax=Malus domestica TaxID=3750 RepID=A0A498KCK9_MALDO|nr:hypothetical protein DVH24_006353 [Malus domestica]